MLLKRTAALLFALLSTVNAQEKYQAILDPSPVGDLPYQRYFTRDAFSRRITFYVCSQVNTRAPLVVFILGSGAHSHFASRGGQILDAHRALRAVLVNHASLLIIEKPGVAFLGQPTKNGTAEGASDEFRVENTLERWSEAVNSAIQAAKQLPVVDTTRILLMGHSEGARVAARVAAGDPSISHVALLAGSGAPHLFSLMELARGGQLFADQSSDPEQRVKYLLQRWSEIQGDPDNSKRDFLGHPFRWWSSFAKSDPQDELLRTRARIYLAHGTLDRNNPVAAFDLLYASLIAKQADVTAERVEGADHGFLFPNQPQRDGQRELFLRILNWFEGKLPRSSH